MWTGEAAGKKKRSHFNDTLIMKLSGQFIFFTYDMLYSNIVDPCGILQTSIGPVGILQSWNVCPSLYYFGVQGIVHMERCEEREGQCRGISAEEAVSSVVWQNCARIRYPIGSQVCSNPRGTQVDDLDHRFAPTKDAVLMWNGNSLHLYVLYEERKGNGLGSIKYLAKTRPLLSSRLQ